MTHETSRREFLKIAGRFGALGVAAPMGLQLVSAAEAASATGPSDYKALVCVFLYGGNDAYNTLVPMDTASYNAYARSRGALAVSRTALAPYAIDPSNAPQHSRALAFNPAAASFKTMFDRGDLAVLANAGTLLAPTTLDDFRNKRNLPPKLMSHNDQFSQWQTLLAEGAQTGWGGRLADRLAAGNADNALLTALSVGASSAWCSGETIRELTFGNTGPATLRTIPGAPTLHQDINNRLWNSGSANLTMAEMTLRYQSAVTGGQRLGAVMGPVGSMVSVPDDANSDDPQAIGLGAQLDTLARMIVASATNLSIRRQVYFVGLGGWDNHGDLGTTHPRLLSILSTRLLAFQNALNAAGLGRNVTTFTASDFGRALVSNGGGVDHGWGGHHFVMGGAVKARYVAGDIPVTQIGGPQDVGQGRLLPTASVEQYGATLARWFGVPVADLTAVFPRLDRFQSTDLGFMQ